MNAFEILPAVVVVVAALIVAGIAVRARWQKHRLRGASRARVLSRWKQAMLQQDPHRRLMEADTVLDAILTELGYSGSVGEKLRKAGRFVPSLDGVWKAHKLRNRIAHEVGTSIPERELKDAFLALERTVTHFCR
ncbi:MAG: hypothetical protein AAB728_03415 [Patescibacteria group bacterium]